MVEEEYRGVESARMWRLFCLRDIHVDTTGTKKKFTVNKSTTDALHVIVDDREVVSGIVRECTINGGFDIIQAIVVGWK